VSVAVLALGTAAVGVVPAPALLVSAVLLAGAAAPATRVLVNSLALQSTPSNRAGATSMALAVQFLGAALVPTVLPLYDASPAAAAAVLGAICLSGALLAR
jgi:ACDE family multidrug resistance protein